MRPYDEWRAVAELEEIERIQLALEEIVKDMRHWIAHKDSEYKRELK